MDADLPARPLIGLLLRLAYQHYSEDIHAALRKAGFGDIRPAIETEPTQPNEIGMHRVAFSVDDIDKALEIASRHGCHPLRGVATYEDVYKLTYIRGPSGIIVMLAQELNNR